MKPITFVLFAYNEEKRIAYAVRNFIHHGSVVIMDGGSTDKTQEIAESLGATFLRRPKSSLPQVETQVIFDFVKENTETPWIYWGYVDNIAPETLVKKLVDIASDSVYKKVTVPMYTYLWGNTKHYAQKSHFPAMFHRAYMDFSKNQIHHLGQFTGASHEEIILPNREEYALRHFSTYVESKYVAGYMRYAEEEAQQKFKDGERFSVVKLFAAMLRYMWIYRRTFKTSQLGILIMLNMAFGRLMTYTRLYEYEHGITLESVEHAYSLEKEKLLHAKSH